MGKGLVKVLVMVYDNSNIMQLYLLLYILLEEYCRQE